MNDQHEQIREYYRLKNIGRIQDVRITELEKQVTEKEYEMKELYKESQFWERLIRQKDNRQSMRIVKDDQ